MSAEAEADLAATRRSPRLTKPRSQPADRSIRAHATMGPGSGEEQVNPSKWLKAHEKEQQLPPGER